LDLLWLRILFMLVVHIILMLDILLLDFDLVVVIHYAGLSMRG
jgi:hypothetical protein